MGYRCVVLILALFLAGPALVEAASPTTFVWDRNTEIDMLEYKVYTCATSSTCVPAAPAIGTVPQPATGTSPSFPIPANSQGRAAVTAVDLVGNESGLSNVVSYDRQPPPNPQNLRAQ